MNDQATGDMPWLQEPAAPAPARQPRQQRKPREAAAPKPEKAPRKPRTVSKSPLLAAGYGKDMSKKPRAAKAERAAPDTIKVTLKEFAQMRVGDDAKLFLKLHGVLSSAGKASRTKVLAELSKVFG